MNKKQALKEYQQYRDLAKPIEILTGWQAHAYSPAYIIFRDTETNRDYDIPVPFLRALCNGIEKDKTT